MVVERDSLFSLIPRANVYIEISDGPSDYSCHPPYWWATCGDCGWDGGERTWADEARRDFWRHPWLVCWIHRRFGICLPVQRRSLRQALRYWHPRRLTLRTNYDGTPRRRVHAWLWWNF